MVALFRVSSLGVDGLQGGGKRGRPLLNVGLSGLIGGRQFGEIGLAVME
jgi:hypothetical protein